MLNFHVNFRWFVFVSFFLMSKIRKSPIESFFLWQTVCKDNTVWFHYQTKSYDFMHMKFFSLRFSKTVFRFYFHFATWDFNKKSIFYSKYMHNTLENNFRHFCFGLMITTEFQSIIFQTSVLSWDMTSYNPAFTATQQKYDTNTN